MQRLKNFIHEAERIYQELPEDPQDTWRPPTNMPTKKINLAKKVVVQMPTQKRRAVNRPSQQREARNRPPIFGPVSTIDTAPVSIGNTFTGAKPIITAIPGGQRIKGRDFLVNVDPTATSVTGWTLVAAVPLSPVCMVSSGLKSMMNMYSKYMVHGVAFHYVTACTTGDSGSIMLYIGKGRGEPGLITDNPNFLPVVLSDPNTVISPVWKNCSAVFHPTPVWLTSDIFNADGLHEQAVGELFVFTRIPSANIPGYILVDYDMSFSNMQVNIKSLSLPISRMKYTQVRLADITPVANQVATYTWDFVGQFLLDGVTNTAAPSGAAVSDIYKIIININDGYQGMVPLNAAFFMNFNVAGGATVVPGGNFVDGATIYGVCNTVGLGLVLFPTYYAASTNATPLLQTAALVGALHSFIAHVSLVGTVAGILNQSNY